MLRIIQNRYVSWTVLAALLATSLPTRVTCLVNDMPDYGEGYFPFEEAPDLTPPSVRKPPYTQTNALCVGLLPQTSGVPGFYNSLCGDLNDGFLPQNPLGQAPLGEVYPFELIKNKTLEYLSETLPVLKDDSTIPKVAKFQGQILNSAFPRKRKRAARSVEQNKTNVTSSSSRVTSAESVAGRSGSGITGRGLCDGSDGILCRFFSTLFPQRMGQVSSHRIDNQDDDVSTNDVIPLASTTPCPSKAEYASPIFAKNYQGLWRYVVQIPYEGYLTQTVEVTRCMQGHCNFLDGQCLASPRWVSLLVAEIFYPDAFFPTTPPPQRPTTPLPHFHVPAPPVADFQNFQQYLVRRAGNAPFVANHPQQQQPQQRQKASKRVDTANPAAPEVDKTSEYCDGHDQIGCFQIRLFYDWFLVPGACKCWKPSGKNILLNN